MKQLHLLYTTPFLLIALFITITPRLVSAQDSINYDETKVPPYSLPDPLQLPNGKHITTTEQWMQQQRPAMLKLFADNVYGRMPGKPQHMHFVGKFIGFISTGWKSDPETNNYFLYTRAFFSFNGIAPVSAPVS
jgi:hypothetical protein